jgi:hypothetical protein
METTFSTWPPDADGDVLRRLAERGFDFSSELSWLSGAYSRVEVHEPDGEFDGYVLVQLTSRLSHELVISTQQHISEAMAPYGGICESWGVLQGSPQ